MQLTEKNFCPNIKDLSTSLKLNYICKKTGKLCPKVDYSSGKALPSKLFVKNGCPLKQEEEKQIVEEVKEVKEEVKEVPAQEKTVEAVVKVAEEPIKKTILEDVQKEVEVEEVVVKEQKKVNTQQNRPRTNSTCKKVKKNNNNNK